MDLKLVREKAIEETTRFFLDKHGILPDEDSDEWEAEYRRHFEQVKKRYAAGRSAEPAKIPTGGRVAAAGAALPEIKGAPAQKRWAELLRAERLKEIQNQETRSWLAGAWTSAEDWIDTREMAAAAFLRRVGAQFEEHRRRSTAQERESQAERDAKAAAAAAIHRQVEAAGITAAGLVELVDVSARAATSPLKGKLAEIDVAGRSLRVFESDNPATLMVIENGAAGRTEYGIERDEGLVADLKLFMQDNAG